jgi:predicted alpha-1,2-mannosidase
MLIRFKTPLFPFLISVILFVRWSSAQTTPPIAWVDFVNPLLGTANATTPSALKFSEKKESNAQVVPFVTAPFGMTQWTPETRISEQKCVAPYYYKDNMLTGFRASHWISGSCTQDYGSFTLMPQSGALKPLAEQRATPFSHQNENASPYHYEVFLESQSLNVKMTATKRSGFLEIDFPENLPAHLLIIPNSDEGEGYVRIDLEKKEVVGYNPVHRIYQGWGEPAGFSGYFVIQFDQPLEDYGVFQKEHIYSKKIMLENQKALGAYLTFSAEAQKKMQLKVGTSFTSIEGARENLRLEIGNSSYEHIKNQLQSTWNSRLGKVEVETKQEDLKPQFYTALYHSFLLPRVFNDVNGQYPSFDGGNKIEKIEEGDYYVDFSMWDTYRALHPLLTLLAPDVAKDMMRSLFLKAKQGGWLPIFPAWNSYTAAMIGDHCITTLADAALKGIYLPDEEEYNYMIQNAFELPNTEAAYILGKGRRALPSYLKNGFVPLEDDVPHSFHKKEQVSRTLEYAFNDFALYQLACMRQDKTHAKALKKRSLNYKNVFSPQDRAVRGKYASGAFYSPFVKNERQFYITEGSPFQYTWYVPHDMSGLMTLMGGEETFNKTLDAFKADGHYWHGNEPGHHIPFLYNFSGQGWKTQAWVNQIVDNEYSNSVGGLSGNDDAGQMSAWYVFATLGFYPVAPSVPQYVVSGPRFERITIQLSEGKTLQINAPERTAKRHYIQSVKFNNKSYTATFFTHNDLMQGGEVHFSMGISPNKKWGIKEQDRPFSLSQTTTKDERRSNL